MNGMIALLAATMFMAVVSGPASAVSIDRDFHESFDVRDGFRLSLHSGDGNVTIEPWNSDVIDVTVLYRADVTRVGLGGPPDFNVEFKTGVDFVRVIGNLTPQGPAVFQSMRIHEYTYTIKAPPYVILEIDGDDGDVEISGWRADIECSMDDGDLTLTDVVNSRTRASLEDGDMSALNLSGELQISSDDGDVRLSSCELTDARISLEDGDITVDDCEGDFAIMVDDGNVSLGLRASRSIRVRAADGDVDIAIDGGNVDEVDVVTDDGDVMISMPAGSSYEFLVTADDGRIKVDVPERDEYEKDEHSATGQIRGGEGTVRVRTNDGNVRLREG